MRTHMGRTRRGTMVAALVIAWTAWAAGAVLTVGRVALAQCPELQNACFQSVPVPCQNATCVASSLYPAAGIPTCTNCGGCQAPRWSATVTATGWFGCRTLQGPGASPCGEDYAQCSNVTFYADTGCSVLCSPISAYTLWYCKYSLYSPGPC